MEISCNICKKSLKGRTLVTSCSHIFCPKCIGDMTSSSSSSSSSSNSTTITNVNACPICAKDLAVCDIGNTVVGFGSAITSNISIQDQLWEYFLQNQSWSQSINLLDEISNTVNQMQRMIKVQLLMLIEDDINRIEEITEEQERQKNILLQNDSTIFNLQRNSDANIKRLENLLYASEKQVVELQNAYIEKKDRCVAWENAYHQVSNKRNELMNTSNLIHNSPSALASPSLLTPPSVCPSNIVNANFITNANGSDYSCTKNSNNINFGIPSTHHRNQTCPVPALPPRESNPEKFFNTQSNPLKGDQNQIIRNSKSNLSSAQFSRNGHQPQQQLLEHQQQQKSHPQDPADDRFAKSLKRSIKVQDVSHGPSSFFMK